MPLRADAGRWSWLAGGGMSSGHGCGGVGEDPGLRINLNGDNNIGRSIEGDARVLVLAIIKPPCSGPLPMFGLRVPRWLPVADWALGGAGTSTMNSWAFDIIHPLPVIEDAYQHQ
jgi:hypothetical protein